MDLWLPPKPAIIRPADKKLLRPLMGSFIPGMFPSGAAAGPIGGISTISFIVSTAAINGNAITLPASIQAGDLIALVDYADGANGPAPTFAVPNFFTLAIDMFISGTNARVIMSYKIADGSEAGTMVSPMPSPFQKISLLFRGDKAMRSISLGGVQSASTGGSLPPPLTITSGDGRAPLVVLHSGVSQNANGLDMDAPYAYNFDGVTNDAYSANSNFKFGYRIFNSAPANVVTRLIANSGGRKSQMACYLSCL